LRRRGHGNSLAVIWQKTTDIMTLLPMRCHGKTA
jgi:hypothetical protein